jgi:deoxyhypusine synthase
MNDAREFHDGQKDGLVALESLDLDKVKSFAGLLRAMSRTAFSGRSLGEALDVTVAMVKDPDCKVVLTLSGAMTIAKMGRIIRGFSARQVPRSSSAALLAHGMSERSASLPATTGHVRRRFRKGYSASTTPKEANSATSGLPPPPRALDQLADGELSSGIINPTLGEVRRGSEASSVLLAPTSRRCRLRIPAFTDSARARRATCDEARPRAG